MWPDDECVIYVAKPAEGLIGRRLQSHFFKIFHEIIILHGSTTQKTALNVIGYVFFKVRIKGLNIIYTRFGFKG
jgi:hypothetical protein